jgi:hypothetical protein
MAKPKFPKKNNSVQGVVSPASTQPPVSTDIAPPAPATAAALPETETQKTETRKPEPRKAVRKPEIVRTDARGNLVPINLDDEIRRLAYLFSERRGFEPGHENEDWLAAEHEVRQRYHQQSA